MNAMADPDGIMPVEQAAPGRSYLDRHRRSLVILAAMSAVVAIIFALMIFRPFVSTPDVQRPKPLVTSRRVVPKTELPPVDPVRYQPVDQSDARSFNASIPIVAGANPAAPPFRLTAVGDDRLRAIDCLAVAELYEAGDDAVGQRAVAQVILNRVRHPVFPKTVCGVVFQGSERTTGCQFSFACDGSFNRWRPNDAMLTRARAVATAALDGAVFDTVGLATQYHADYVVPYWSSSFSKIAQVGAHLFYKWSGWWGSPAAFSRTPSPSEPVIAAMAQFSPAHRTGAEDGETGSPGIVSTGGGTMTVVTAPLIKSPTSAKTLPPGVKGIGLVDANSFLVTATPTGNGDNLLALARATCGARALCQLLAWTDAGDTPKALPLKPGEARTMAFSYTRDSGSGFEQATWNCQRFKRPRSEECLTFSR